MASKSKKDAQNNVLDFNSFIAAAAPKLTLVNIPELGGSIYLKGLSALDIIEFAGARSAAGDSASTREVQHQAMVHLISKSVVDADGKPLFDSADKVLQLKSSNYKIFTAVAAAVTANAGLTATKEEIEAAELEMGKD